MIDSIDSLSPTISKEWIGLILLPTVGSLAGKFPCRGKGFVITLTVLYRVHHGDERLGQGSNHAQRKRGCGVHYRKSSIVQVQHMQ